VQLMMKCMTCKLQNLLSTYQSKHQLET
jgi:hypothetical protein